MEEEEFHEERRAVEVDDDDDDLSQLDEVVAADLDAKDRCCESCVQFGEGQIYYFWAGFREWNDAWIDRVWANQWSWRSRVASNWLETGAVSSNTYRTTTKYRHVSKYHAYLCDRCINNAWRFRCVPPIIVGLLPGLLLCPPSLLILIRTWPCGIVCLLFSFVIAGMCSVVSGYFLFCLVVGPKTRNHGEKAAIQLMRSKLHRCNYFWTTAEYATFRRRF
jgi:hypothetical protein